MVLVLKSRFRRRETDARRTRDPPETQRGRTSRTRARPVPRDDSEGRLRETRPLAAYPSAPGSAAHAPHAPYPLDCTGDAYQYTEHTVCSVLETHTGQSTVLCALCCMRSMHGLVHRLCALSSVYWTSVCSVSHAPDAGSAALVTPRPHPPIFSLTLSPPLSLARRCAGVPSAACSASSSAR